MVVSWTFGCFSQAKCSEFEQVVWTYLECASGTHLVFWVTIFGEIIVWWVRSVLAGTSFRSFAVGDAFHLGAVHCYMYITWNFYDLFSLSSLLLTFENSVLLSGACKLTAEHNRLQGLNKRSIKTQQWVHLRMRSRICVRWRCNCTTDKPMCRFLLGEKRHEAWCHEVFFQKELYKAYIYNSMAFSSDKNVTFLTCAKSTRLDFKLSRMIVGHLGYLSPALPRYGMLTREIWVLMTYIGEDSVAILVTPNENWRRV